MLEPCQHAHTQFINTQTLTLSPPPSLPPLSHARSRRGGTEGHCLGQFSTDTQVTPLHLAINMYPLLHTYVTWTHR